MPGDQWDKLIQKAFYGLASACAIYAVGQVSHLSSSVEDLNRNVAVLIASHGEQELKNRDIEIRLRYLETRRK
jgi:hypothetical protein